MIFELDIINVLKIATFVRVQCRAIFNILRMRWAFSIAVYASTCMNISYVDICARFFTKPFLWFISYINFVVRISYLFVTVWNFFKLLDVLSPNRRSQLISATSDAARNMTGHVSGVIMRLQQCSLEEFISVWCILHQLDILLQKVYMKLDGDAWYARLVFMILHLRRQQKLISKMKSTCQRHLLLDDTSCLVIQANLMITTVKPL